VRSHAEEDRERPFGCEFCGRRFRVKYNMKEHVKLHLGDRPFVCEICRKPFTRPDKLKAHTLRHVYEPTLTSDVCADLDQVG